MVATHAVLQPLYSPTVIEQSIRTSPSINNLDKYNGISQLSTPDDVLTLIKASASVRTTECN